ncbi:MAG: hypothetical protein KGM95_10330 [Betaproteobacteria bacterium]|nr:hypothetical protein [Betaproteobacteria bacterium]
MECLSAMILVYRPCPICPGNPFERYRFEFLSENLRQDVMLERFVDEMLPNINFSYLRAQSSATIEAAEPTLFHLTDCSGYRFPEYCYLYGKGAGQFADRRVR